MTIIPNPLTDRTNVTPTSYDYNGTTYTKQTRTDGNGNPYTVDIANTTPAVPAVTTPTGATTPPATTGVVTTPTPNTGTTPQTIGSLYGIDPNKATSDYASYLANPDQYLSNQGISVGDLKSKALAELQSSIDATNAFYGNKLNQAKQQGAGILGQTGAIQARRGLLGSDFGAAQTDSINNSNNEIYNSIEAERAAKIADLMSGAQSKAEQRFAEQRASIEGGLKSRLEFLKGADERAKTAATDAASAFVAQGTDPSIMDTKTLNEYAKAHGTTPDAIKTAFALNTYATKQAKIKADQDLANKLAEKGIQTIGEGQSGYVYNPKTGKNELVAHVNKTYAPKEGSAGSTGKGLGIDSNGKIIGISPAAQTWIDKINRDGGTPVDYVPGTSKASQQLRDEIQSGLNLQGGYSNYDKSQNLNYITDIDKTIKDLSASKDLSGTFRVMHPSLNLNANENTDFLNKVDLLTGQLLKLDGKALKSIFGPQISNSDAATIKEIVGKALNPSLQTPESFQSSLDMISKGLNQYRKNNNVEQPNNAPKIIQKMINGVPTTLQQGPDGKYYPVN